MHSGEDVQLAFYLAKQQLPAHCWPSTSKFFPLGKYQGLGGANAIKFNGPTIINLSFEELKKRWGFL